MVYNVAPSGSSPIRPSVTALRAIPVSNDEEAGSPGVLVWNGVSVDEIASAPGVRRDMTKVEETSPVSGEADFVFVCFFFPSDLHMNLDMT